MSIQFAEALNPENFVARSQVKQQVTLRSHGSDVKVSSRHAPSRVFPDACLKSIQAYYSRLCCNPDQAQKIKAIYDKTAYFHRIFDLCDETGRGVEHQGEARALLAEIHADEETRVNLESRWGIAFQDSWMTQARVNDKGEMIQLKKTRTLLQWSVISCLN